jgi:hypothetical protein
MSDIALSTRIRESSVLAVFLVLSVTGTGLAQEPKET